MLLRKTELTLVALKGFSVMLLTEITKKERKPDLKKRLFRIYVTNVSYCFCTRDCIKTIDFSSFDNS